MSSGSLEQLWAILSAKKKGELKKLCRSSVVTKPAFANLIFRFKGWHYALPQQARVRIGHQHVGWNNNTCSEFMSGDLPGATAVRLRAVRYLVFLFVSSIPCL
jgi:hypothetical protein